MTKERKAVAGIVGLGFDGYFNGVDEIVSRVARDVSASGQVELRSIPAVCNYDQGQRAIAAFNPSGCDFLLVVAASWLDARGAMPFILANRALPILLYSTGGRTGKDGVLLSPAAGAGTPAILETMRSCGIRYEYIFEEPDEPTMVADIVRYAGVARAVTDLKGKRLGSFGFGDMGLYSVNFDNAALRNVFGVSTEFIDLLEVEKRAGGMPAAEVQKEMAGLKAGWKCVGKAPKDATYERVARYYLAVRGMAREKGLAAVSIKCVEGMMAHMECAPCMIGTLLGDAYPYVCENDVPGMLGHVILNSLTGEPVTFVESYEFWKDRVLFGVCGFLPESMIEGPKVAKLFRTDPWEGLMNCSRMKTGRVTLVRPCFRDGKFRVHAVSGSAVAARKWLEVGFVEPGMHPSVEVVLDGTMAHFLANVPAQHFSLAYGDWAREVGRMCRILGVEFVHEEPRK